MNRTFTIQAKAAEKIISLAIAHGVTPESLYEVVKLDPTTLLDRDNRIPFAQLVALYEKAAELTGDVNFGLHLGESVHPSAFDVVGYSALNSPTIGAAFTRVARYHSIWTDGAHLAVLPVLGNPGVGVARTGDGNLRGCLPARVLRSELLSSRLQTLDRRHTQRLQGTQITRISLPINPDPIRVICG